MKPDPLIEDVRQVRREISRECGHDIRKLGARYQAMQKRLKAQGWHIVSQPVAGRTEKTPASTAR